MKMITRSSKISQKKNSSKISKRLNQKYSTGNFVTKKYNKMKFVQNNKHRDTPKLNKFISKVDSRENQTNKFMEYPRIDLETWISDKPENLSQPHGADLFPNPPRPVNYKDDVVLIRNNTTSELSNGLISSPKKDADVIIIEDSNKIQTNKEIFKTSENVTNNKNSRMVQSFKENFTFNEKGNIEKSPNNNIIKIKEIADNTLEKNFERNIISLPAVSPSSSLSSYHSSTESTSSIVSSKKKKKKRHCNSCSLNFRKTRELVEHLKSHVTLPTIELVKLTEDNELYKEYVERTRKLQLNEIEQGSLKLKLKLSGSQNFQVVPYDNLSENKQKKGIRILRAEEISQYSSQPGPIEAMAAMSEFQNKLPNQPTTISENKYFECPTLDGLDQFVEDANTKAADDLLKNILENQQFQNENTEWACNSNEFISIDRLAHMCSVCNATFADTVHLYEHKKVTGHDYHASMQPPPLPPRPSHLAMQNNINCPRLSYQAMHMGGHNPGVQGLYNQNGNQINNMGGRGMYGFPQRFPMFRSNYGQQQMVARRPPPLYRAPQPQTQSSQPANMAPFMEMNPEMYIPSSNTNIMSNHNFPIIQQQQPNLNINQNTRQPIFLKARLQRHLRPGTPTINDHHSPNGTPSPPVMMTSPTVTRPRFLIPTNQSSQTQPAKKMKRDVKDTDTDIIKSQPRSDGLPVIQSVQGGVTEVHSGPIENEKVSNPVQLNEQLTITLKNKDNNKNPRDVANILANRGIIVTHKSKPMISNEQAQKIGAQEAVHKLQLNNSVSIISKKRPADTSESNIEEQTQNNKKEPSFISCPVAECEENFSTIEGLNRHTQKGHKMVKINVKSVRCKLCPAVFTSQDALSDHQRKIHRLMKTTADELGIPVIDLRNEQTKQKLAALGIINYIPLNTKTPNACYGFPIVSVQGAANPNICNMSGLGVNQLLSLGPIKPIPTKKNDT